MRKTSKFFYRVNTRILVMMLILFTITAFVVSRLNQIILTEIYEDKYTERTLLNNHLLATVINSDDIKYYVEMLTNQNEEFKKRQVRFYYDREELVELIQNKASYNEQLPVIERIEEFYHEMKVFKDDKYWHIIKDIRYLKEVSNCEYIYVFADTGVRDEDGTKLYTFIIDADDYGIYYDPSNDGLGTVDLFVDEEEKSVEDIYRTGEKMKAVFKYDEPKYGELYYAYAPVLDKDGSVIAIFGTDISLEEMNRSKEHSIVLLSALFISCSIIIILVIYIFMRTYITKPLGDLTDTAQSLADGNVYTFVPESVLRQQSELGELAHAVDDMSNVYKRMIKSTEELFAAANIGKLDVRNDASKYKGDIKKVIQQINATLDSMTLYLNGVPEGIFIMSKNFEMYFRNEQYVKFFGTMPASEFIANMFRQQYQESDSELLKKQFLEVLEQENNNTTLWINDFCFSITLREINLSETNQSSVLAVAVNITDLMREKENAQAAAKAKSEFLSSMSHEIRTPLNAINGMTAIGKAAPDVEKKNYSFDKIENASTHLLGIINDILDMSKIDANKLELSIVEFNFEKMLQKVVDIISFRVDEKHQNLYVNIDKNIPARIIGDDQRIAQVITNLLSNAVKFTPDNGSIHLNTQLVEEKDGVCVIQIEVADTGIGISYEQQAKLFASFQQADSRMSRSFGGTGLGLAISKRIVDIMGGHIWVNSELGKGATFTFTITVERDKATQENLLIPDDICATVDETGDIFTGCRLLLAEDIEINREIVLTMLEDTELEIDCAENGEIAMQMFKDNPERYDMIFMDMQMPEVDGLEATRCIRALDVPHAKTIPIIAMTANVFREDIEKCIDSGMNDHLGKPLDFDALFEKLRKYLPKKSKNK